MRTHTLIFPLLLVLISALGTLTPNRAWALGQEMCNETSYVIYLATGIPQGDGVHTEGWVRLRPGQCRIVLPAPFSKAPYYAYGYSSNVHGGGRQQWGGQTSLCVDETGNFALDGKGNCAALGLQTRKFNTIDVNPPDGGRTVLAEPSAFGTRAELAGIQRLLNDNGYPMRSVDGYNGRRTRSAIRKFLNAHKISPKPDNAGLIDALEAAAKEALKTTGLRVCNHTTLPVWTAYGRRKGREWQSRGWWKIAPRACTVLLSGLVKDKSFYLYAGMEGPKGEQVLVRAKDKFCISDVLFAISGRDKCKQRGYNKGAFALYKNESGKGMTITLTPEDFGKTDIVSGLRR